MDHDEALAEKLRRVGYDLDLLTEDQRVEIFTLARSARVEIWRPGVRWPSSLDAAVTGGAITRVDAGRP